MKDAQSLPSPFDDWMSFIDFVRAHERPSLGDVFNIPFRSVLSVEAFRKLDNLLTLCFIGRKRPWP